MAPSQQLALLPGTLELLILRTLRLGPAHGHQITKHIQWSTEDLLRVEHGSLYPALHRLERRGWLAATWEKRDGNREFKYYRLTAVGRKHLIVEESKWARLVDGMAKVTARTEG
ncbi:MAG: PadR family transcriptional regulator [Vicinamibacterales bacterium]